MREWPDGPTLSEQEAILRAAGITDFAAEGCQVCIESTPKRRGGKIDPSALKFRDALIRSLGHGEGDVLVVSHLEVLALSVPDLLAVAKRIAEKGAIIRDASRNAEYRWHPDAASIADAMEILATLHERRRMAKARRTRAEKGIRSGPAPKLEALTEEQRAELLADWSNPDAGTNAEIAAARGVSEFSVRRFLGISREDAIRKAHPGWKPSRSRPSQN